MDYEIDFMSVGDSHGDAICLRSGTAQTGYSVDVIDGGYSDVGDSVVSHIASYYGTDRIANLILTHADDDHARGLINVMEACEVGALWMNRPWRFADQVLRYYHGNFTLDGLIDDLRESHPYLVELEEIAAQKGTPVFDVFQGQQYGPFTVLAPSRDRYISLIPFLKGPDAVREPEQRGGLFAAARNVIDRGLEYWGVETLEENPEPTSESNETSLVQLARFGEYRALFTGDVGPQGLIEAAQYANQSGLLRPPDFFHIPHQGSRRNVTPTALNAWLGPHKQQGQPMIGAAACSVGANKNGHPRKKVTNALLRRGYNPKVARGAVLGYSNLSRPGWTAAPSIPFYNDVEEVA